MPFKKFFFYLSVFFKGKRAVVNPRSATIVCVGISVSASHSVSQRLARGDTKTDASAARKSTVFYVLLAEEAFGR